MAKRPVPLYDFAAFGQAIKAARTARKESRKDVSDAMIISPRYLTMGLYENNFAPVPVFSCQNTYKRQLWEQK